MTCVWKANSSCQELNSRTGVGLGCFLSWKSQEAKIDVELDTSAVVSADSDPIIGGAL